MPPDVDYERVRRLRVALIQRPDLLDHSRRKALATTGDDPVCSQSVELERFLSEALAIQDSTEFERSVARFERGASLGTGDG